MPWIYPREYLKSALHEQWKAKEAAEADAAKQAEPQSDAGCADVASSGEVVNTDE